MSGFNIREKASKGWHPKGKDGKSKESWRGDFKGMDQIVSNSVATVNSERRGPNFHSQDGWGNPKAKQMPQIPTDPNMLLSQLLL